MKKLLFLITSLFTTLIYAQYSIIPDSNFEYALIQEGFDDVMDGKVLTSNINSIVELDVSVWIIQDLTGIEDFTALEILKCNDNALTVLDVSNNHNLIFLDASDNQIMNLNISGCLTLESLWFSGNLLTSIDVSNNINLLELILNDNQLNTLDVAANTFLSVLWCDFNNLTQLDVSQNQNMHEIYCGDNPINFLNIQNGNNPELEYFDALNIPSNACIQVDDAVAASNANTFPYNEWEVDNLDSFSENCNLSINSFKNKNFVIFPNPAINFVSIITTSSFKIEKIEIYNTSGIFVKSKIENGETLNISNLAEGLYLLKVIFDNGETAIQKMIKK